MADETETLKARVAELEARLRNVAVCFCGDAWIKRGLHAPECWADEGLLDEGTPTLDALLDAAEARGRAHGALACAMRIMDGERHNRAEVDPTRTTSDENWWKTRADALANAAHACRILAESAHDA